jgi:hypothetical protein
MLGQAALAMWWDMAPGMRDEFEHWHSHEHFPERLALPGFLRASRWADASGGEGFFVLYELATYGVLVSPEYLASLNAPSAWSRKMMPHHRNMVRSQCHVLESSGAVVAGHALTLHLSPAAGQEVRLRGSLRELGEVLSLRPGLAGAHLLQTESPPLAPTTEQKIRGLADRAADWIYIVTGFEPRDLRMLCEGELSASALQAAGAAQEPVTGLYALRLSALANSREGSGAAT